MKDVYALQAALEEAKAAIREKEEAIQAAQASTILLQKTFASLNEAVFIVQTGTRVILKVNKAVETLFGYPEEEIVGRSTSCLHLTEEMSVRFGREMIAAYREKGYYETTYQMLRKDGTIFDSEHCVTPIHDNNGEIISHVCVVRDITQRKRSEEQLKELNDSLELRIAQAVEEQRQFMGLVSHELRTPLSIIDGTAQLLAIAACKDKECRTHAERILSSTKRLTNLIDTCLTEDRLCTSGWIPAMRPEDIRSLARNAVAQAQTGTVRHQISCRLDELPDRFTCDSMLIQVMLNNLLDNAIKYSPEGGAINLHGWYTKRGELFFEVIDQGVGIVPDQIDKAFDRFYRIWQVPGIAGAGLGLHIVKRVAELHGGTAWCKSQPGLGSTFTVSLPDRPAS